MRLMLAFLLMVLATPALAATEEALGDVRKLVQTTDERIAQVTS